MSWFREVWSNYRVLIVMIPSIGLIHVAWYKIKTHPLMQKKKEEVIIPEPAIVTYITQLAAQESKKKAETKSD